MAFASQNLEVLIASPSDLSEERQAAKQAISDWNDLHAKAEGVTLHAVMWETHAVPEAGIRPQEAINKQLVKDADILIGLFWTKLGTNTGVAESGTVEEVDQIVAAGKPAMLYFSTRPVDPTKIDLTQLERLTEFRAKTYQTALTGTFDSPQALRTTLAAHLTRRVRMMKESADFVQFTPADNRKSQIEAKRSFFETQIVSGSFRELPFGPKMAVSIFPLRSMKSLIDVADIAHNRQTELQPLGPNGWNTDLYGESVVAHNATRARGERPAEPPSAVVELTDDGAIYAATEIYVGEWQEHGSVLPLERHERELLAYIGRCIALQRRLGVEGPLELRIVFSGIGKAKMIPFQPVYWDTRSFRPLTDGVAYIGPVTLDEAVDGSSINKIAEAVRTGFTKLWRNAGVANDPCYDSDGTYRLSAPSY